MEEIAGPTAVLRRVLANRDLRRVLPAFLVFSAAEYGTWVAILLYAYEQTGPASVGLVALVQLVPAGLVAPAAATLGDRFPRHRVLTLGYVVQAIAMLATAGAMLAGLPVAIVYLAAAAAATSVVVTRPTQSALLPSLAGTTDDLTAANGTAGVAEGVGALVGPLAAARSSRCRRPRRCSCSLGSSSPFRPRPRSGFGRATVGWARSTWTASRPRTSGSSAGCGRWPRTRMPGSSWDC